MPGTPVIGFTNLELLIIGVVCTAGAYALTWLVKRTRSLP